MGAATAGVSLARMAERLAIARLSPAAPLPGWATSSPFFSVTRTRGELSIVRPEERVPDGIEAVRGWRSFACEGPLDLGLVGILASIAVPLGDAGISLFAISTHDTDYVLVRDADFDRAAEVLAGRGHRIGTRNA